MFWLNYTYLNAFRTNFNIHKQFKSYLLQIRFFSAHSNHSRWYFDTFQLVKQLEKEGFTKQQSLSIMQALQAVLDESFRDFTKTMVTKDEQERTLMAHSMFQTVVMNKD